MGLSSSVDTSAAPQQGRYDNSRGLLTSALRPVACSKPDEQAVAEQQQETALGQDTLAGSDTAERTMHPDAMQAVVALSRKVPVSLARAACL